MGTRKGKRVVGEHQECIYMKYTISGEYIVEWGVVQLLQDNLEKPVFVELFTLCIAPSYNIICVCV